jgi:hypothetical protein
MNEHSCSVNAEFFNNLSTYSIIFKQNPVAHLLLVLSSVKGGLDGMLRRRIDGWVLFYMIFKTCRGEGKYKTALLKKKGGGGI